MSANDAQAVKYGAFHVRRFAGSRITRTTYQGVAQFGEGDILSCAHTGHLTIDAAASCARKTFPATEALMAIYSGSILGLEPPPDDLDPCWSEDSAALGAR